MASIPESPIGILGGSFDPVHNGHCAVAQLAQEHFSLKKVYFIPAFIPPHKIDTVTISARHRLNMLQKAVQGNKSFCIWDGEIKRGGISFTVDTLRTLKKMYPHSVLYFIIGSDNLSEILTWNNYKKIIKMVTLCVAHRPGYAMRIPSQLSKATIVTFPSPEWGISSTMIRTYLAKGKSCRYILPQKVVEYIKKNKLYRG